MKTIPLALAAAMVAAPAWAADLPTKAPAQTIAYNWTGFYVGANVGGGWGHNSVDATANDPLMAALFALAGAPPAVSYNTSGVVGGAQLGYNWQFKPNWLMGLEADFDGSGVKGSASGQGVISGVVPFANAVDEKVKWLGTVRARLGYLPTPNLLAFVTGGFAYGQVERSGTYTTSAGTVTGTFPPFGLFCTAGVPCFTGSRSSTQVGWALGGGLEYAFARNWTLRGEYMYVTLGSRSITESATALPAGTTIPSSFDANFGRTNLNIARAAVNYRF